MRRLLLVGLALAVMPLGGCITKAVQKQALVDAEPKDDAYCRGIGLPPGSSGYADCRLRLREQMLAEQAEDRRRIGKAVAGFQESIERENDRRALRAAAAASAPTYSGPKNYNCVSTGGAGTITTNCNGF